MPRLSQTNLTKRVPRIEILEPRLPLSCRVRSDNPGTVSGQVFEDLNRDGNQGVEEVGLDSFHIQLVQTDGSGTCRTETSSIDTDRNGEISPSFEQGRFSISGIAPGRYRIFAQYSWKITSQQREFEIQPDASIELLPFGAAEFELGSIEVRSFIDENENGEKEPDESWIERVSIRITGDEISGSSSRISETQDWNNDGRIDPDTETGLFRLSAVPGEYDISATPVSKLFDESLSTTIMLDEGETLQVELGFRPPKFGTVTGQVFNDLNENGIRDDGEVGLNGWRVRVDGRQTYSAVSQDNDLNGDGEINPETESGIYQITDIVTVNRDYRIFTHGKPGWTTHSPVEEEAEFRIGEGELKTIPIGMFQPLPGDFQRDGQIDAKDIDLLCQRIRSRYDFLYDLNGDYRMSLADRDYMLEHILGTTVGDSNLDGQFDSSDLVMVSQAGEFEDDVRNNSNWNEGDWNCDSEFNAFDLISAFRDADYVSAAIVAAVIAEINDSDEKHSLSKDKLSRQAITTTTTNPF